MATLIPPLVRRWREEASFQPDFWRGVRATVAFMPPLVFAAFGAHDLSIVSIAAQNIAMVDVRGDYRLRFALLLAMAGVFCAAAAIGATVADRPTIAILATGLIAVLGGVWRHLSTDYGPPLAISSSLVFLLALASPTASTHVHGFALAALAGGAWGLIVQVAGWPFRPEHPLRRDVADSWVAVAQLFEALRETTSGVTDRQPVITRENEVRTALDQAYAALAATHPGALRTQLEAVNLAAARLATRVVSLDTALEAIRSTPRFAVLSSALDPTLASLANLSRSAALVVVSRQPAHLATFEVRLRRLASLLAVLRGRLGGDAPLAQLVEIVRQLERLLPETHAAVRATVNRATERAAVGLELSDLRTLALRPLASALNFSTAVDPALVRFTLRLAALTMFGTAVFEYLGLPHGYWLPFTIVVVLQPDYGSTRQRASERVLGTIAGSLVASGLLYLELPVAVLLAAVGVGVFFFAFFLKRNYAVAIFFVSIFIVLVTEAHEAVTLAFTIERVLITLAGGALALLAAFIFWPVWERDRLPAILARTFRANQEYLATLLNRLQTGGAYDAEAIAAKRRAEAANTTAFSSLKRLSGDPKNQREGLEHAAALVNGNQRLTRVLNVLTLHLGPAEPVSASTLERFARIAEAALARLAEAAAHSTPVPAELETLIRELEADLFPAHAATERERWIYGQLGRAAIELNALLVVLQNSAPAWAPEPAITA
jgi:uncharacterized membrane protein YccC